MAKDPAFLFYSSDFLTGVSDLTMEERGQYITLLCLHHQKGRLTKKMIGIAVASVSNDVMEKFEMDKDGKFFNKRLEKESKKRADHAQKQRERAIKGWEKRKKQKDTQSKPVADAAALPLENEIDNEDIIINKDDSKEKVFLSKLSSSEYIFSSDMFLTCWKSWLEYKRDAHNFKYKTKESEKAAMTTLIRLNGGDAMKSMMAIEQSIGNQWKGLFKLKEDDRKKTGYDPSNFTPEGIHRIIHGESQAS